MIENIFSKDNQAIGCFICDTKELGTQLSKTADPWRAEVTWIFNEIMAAELKEDL